MKKQIHSITTLILSSFVIVTLSMGSASAGDADHNHGDKDEPSMHAMPAVEATAHNDENKQDMMTAMQAEMQAIIDTEDKAKRQALFSAHKEKMQGMMKKMQHHCDDQHDKKGK